MHLGIPLTLSVLGRTRRADDGRIDDRSGSDLQPVGLEHRADTGEQLRSEIMLLQQAAESQQRRAVRHALPAQIDADESPQCRAVQQRLFARLIGEVEPVLHEDHPQHSLQPHRRTAVAGLGVVRLDHRAELVPRHDPIHRRQELVSSRRLRYCSNAS